MEAIHQLFEDLIPDGYRITKTSQTGRALQVNKETESGYIAIKNDFSTNIIEFALPPTQNPNQLVKLYSEVYQSILLSCERSGLNIFPKGFIRLARESIIPIPGTRLEWLLNRPIPEGGKFRNRYFPATIAATQLHLNILSDDFYRLLPALYSLEYLVPLLFSNSLDTKTRTHCARPLIYRDNYPETYKALGIPSRIPCSKQEYDRLLAETVGFRRDYCFIAPRDIGTVEFRSACCQHGEDAVLELVAFRLLMLSAAKDGLADEAQLLRDHFFEVCETGRADQQLFERDYKRLLTALSEMNSAWRPFAKNYLRRLEPEIDHIIKRAAS